MTDFRCQLPSSCLKIETLWEKQSDLLNLLIKSTEEIGVE